MQLGKNPAPWLHMKLSMYANVIIHLFSVHTRVFALTTGSDLGSWWSLVPTFRKPEHQCEEKPQRVNLAAPR